MNPGVVDPVDDEALARRIAARHDAAAEAELCSRLAPRIRSYGLRHLRDAQAAADLVQDVLVIVLESLRDGRVDEPARLPAFVMGACRNSVLDLRKVQQRRHALLERFGPALAEAVGSSLASTVSAIDAARLGPCIEALPTREQTIVMMTYYGDRPSEEIARELETTPGNVRVVRHRALRRLHECVGAPA